MKSILLYSLLVVQIFALSQERSIDDGIQEIGLNSNYDDVYAKTYTCPAEEIIDLNDQLKFIPEFEDARCIDLKKSKLTKMFNLKVIQGQIFYSFSSSNNQSSINTIKFYLTLPKSNEDKTIFIDKMDEFFGESYHWVDPTNKEIIRMDWTTDLAFGCLQLGYDMATDMLLNHYIFTISRN